MQPVSHSGLKCEVLMVGIHGNNAVQTAVIATCRKFGAAIVARDPQALVVQYSGKSDDVDRLLAEMPPRSIAQICRDFLRSTAMERSGFSEQRKMLR